MAEYTLIDDYVATLRARVAWRRDVDDLLAEVEDHLYSAVARLEATGRDRTAAQHQTLARFGDPQVLAAAYATTTDGGMAMPTTFTRTSGTGAVLACGLWILFAAGQWLALWSEQRLGRWGGEAQVLYGLGALALLGATALTVLLVFGLRRRHGGLGGLGTAGVVLTTAGAVASIITWAFTIWGALLIVGTASVAIAARDRDIAPRPALLLFGGGLATGGLIWIVLRTLAVGTPDVWGDYTIVNTIALTIGSLLVAAGSYGLGAWLRAEEPVDVAQPDTPMPA